MKQRLAKFLKSLGWKLLRIGDRLDPMEEDEGDFVTCESCSAKVDHADAVPSGDCYFCPACHQVWYEEMQKCPHSFSPADWEGEPGFMCSKCCYWTSHVEPPPGFGVCV